MTTAETLISHLKQAGMRITPQRIAICQLLSESGEHPSAAMIYEHIKAQYPSLSLMTVYNTLKTLADLGAINILGKIGDDNAHYDANTKPHAHLICISCHNIIDIISENVKKLNDEITAISEYKLLGESILYYGICPACQKSTTT